MTANPRHRSLLLLVGTVLLVGLLAGSLAALGGDGGTGTDTGGATGAGGEDRALVAEVPLAAGWPAAGGDHTLEGPGPEVPLPASEACGASLPAPVGTVRQAARLTGPEDHRTRALHVFDEPGAAARFVDDLVDVHAGCPEEDLGDDHVRVTDVRDGSPDGLTVDVARFLSVAGSPVIGLEVLHVVRRGRAVLVDTASGEGSGTESTIRSQVQAQEDAAAPVVAAMCRFAAAGC